MEKRACKRGKFEVGRREHTNFRKASSITKLDFRNGIGSAASPQFVESDLRFKRRGCAMRAFVTDSCQDFMLSINGAAIWLVAASSRWT